jgi:hypothetical protein
MSEAMITPTRECNLLAIDIPSITAALNVMKKEFLNASLLLIEIQDASISLENVIQNSHYVDLTAHHEAGALKQSVDKFEVAIHEVQERMTSLEIILKSKVIIPAILSTADDISTAFHIAVNDPEIDWSFAEALLERYLFLFQEDLIIRRHFYDFGKAV